MAGHQCYHCKQWVEEGEVHDCWTTTEAALTAELSEDLRDAWERLRETAVEFGEQRIYASHHSIMFSRKSCYFFVRPKRNFLEVCIFLDRPVKAPQIRSVVRASKTKLAHMLRIVHRDEVEPPVSDWLREAYERQETESQKRVADGGKPAPAKRVRKKGRSRDARDGRRASAARQSAAADATRSRKRRRQSRQR